MCSKMKTVSTVFLRILIYFTLVVNCCAFEVSVLLGCLFQNTSFIHIMKTRRTVFPPSTANNTHYLHQPNHFKATQKKQTSVSEWGNINQEAGTRCRLYSELIRDIVFSLSNGPMCAAMAQRQLVRCSLAGQRKTGVDTKLVDVAEEKLYRGNTAGLLALEFRVGFGLVGEWKRDGEDGGVNCEHGCSARCVCNCVRSFLLLGSWLQVYN